jgi:hypothetical protein
VGPLEHVVNVGRVLDSLGIPWVLGGSLASSIVGEPRSTLDADIAVLLDHGQLDEFVSLLDADHYVSIDMARDAVARGSSFDLLHHESGMKIDLFALGDDVLDRRQIERRMLVELDSGASIWVGAADDQVLRKLYWYQMGEEVSERQWRDVLSILRVQGSRIDRVELLDAAAQAGLADLPTRALEEMDAEQAP